MLVGILIIATKVFRILKFKNKLIIGMIFFLLLTIISKSRLPSIPITNILIVLFPLIGQAIWLGSSIYYYQRIQVDDDFGYSS